ncbi:MAG TPA: hypothetical protein PKH07_01315 [bacterium]|nr:hypothetical protein [bacterium]
MKQDVRCLARVVDAIDLETVFVCSSELEAKELSWELLSHLGLEGDIVSLQFTGSSARVRLRGNVHLPGDTYSWGRRES